MITIFIHAHASITEIDISVGGMSAKSCNINKIRDSSECWVNTQENLERDHLIFERSENYLKV